MFRSQVGELPERRANAAPADRTYTGSRMPVFSRDVRPQIDEFRRAFDKVTGQVARLRDLESQTPTR